MLQVDEKIWTHVTHFFFLYFHLFCRASVVLVNSNRLTAIGELALPQIAIKFIDNF